MLEFILGALAALTVLNTAVLFFKGRECKPPHTEEREDSSEEMRAARRIDEGVENMLNYDPFRRKGSEE